MTSAISVDTSQFPIKRSSLVAGASRRERRQNRRQGTGRITSVRPIAKRSSGIRYNTSARKDSDGLELLEDVFMMSSEEEEEEEDDMDDVESEVESARKDLTQTVPFRAPISASPLKHFHASNIGVLSDEESYPTKRLQFDERRTHVSSRISLPPPTTTSTSTSTSTSSSSYLPTSSISTVSDDDDDDDDDDMPTSSFDHDDMHLDDDYNKENEMKQKHAQDDVDEKKQSPMKSRKSVAPKPVIAKKPPRHPGQGNKKKRQTLQMVDRASHSGLTDHLDAESEHSRYSKRQRIRPLQFWALERVVYSRTSSEDSAFNYLLPTPVDVEPGRPAAITDTRPRGRSHKSKKKSSSKKSKRAVSDSESDDDDVKHVEVPTNVIVLNPETNTEMKKCIAKAQYQIAMEPLGAAMAGKAFEEPSFSTGMLILPPGAIKPKELANNIECFYICSAEPNSLHVDIHGTHLQFSRGDTFNVPLGNTYSLENRSKKKSCKLYFTLITAK